MRIFGTIILLIFFFDTHGQSISGKVTCTDGKPVIGASVWIKEKDGTVGALTDLNGIYYFEIDTTCTTLCVTHFNYITESLQINNRKVINITIRERPVELTYIEVIALIDENSEISRIDKRLKDSTNFLLRFISENIDYPAQLIKSGIQGKVLAKLKIDSTDLSCSVEITRGIENSIDNNIRKTIQSYPDWTSLILRDEMTKKAISSDIYGFSFWLRTEKEYIIPINFTIKKMNNR